MNAAAYYGLAGEIVRFLAPETEADPAGLLITFLCAFGAAVGPRPHALADGSRHPARLNAVLVGRSARARKGTSWAAIKRLFELADPLFVDRRIIGGLASGEGLVADLASRNPGIERCVLATEPEFARLLRVASRSASLSALLREAWDGNSLAVLTRSKPLKAPGASVAVLGHVTADELRMRLSDTEISNGLANRFLFGWVERSQRLPSGGRIDEDELEALALQVADAIEAAQAIDLLTRSPEADRLWTDIYTAIDDEVDGIVGSLTARAEAQLLRLSVVFALLDGSSTIEVWHLLAAQAVWAHCEETIERVFAKAEVADIESRLLAALEQAGDAGLDGSQQRDLFSRHLRGSRLATARVTLERRGLARTEVRATGGRPRIISIATTPSTPTTPARYSPRSLSSHLSSPESLVPLRWAPRADNPVTSPVTEPEGTVTESNQ